MSTTLQAAIGSISLPSLRPADLPQHGPNGLPLAGLRNSSSRRFGLCARNLYSFQPRNLPQARRIALGASAWVNPHTSTSMQQARLWAVLWHAWGNGNRCCGVLRVMQHRIARQVFAPSWGCLPVMRLSSGWPDRQGPKVDSSSLCDKEETPSQGRRVTHSGGVTSLSESDFLVTPFITSTTCFLEHPTASAVC